jgi:dTDP-4-amino-4,6-dideoxygalactose transaminase
MEFGARWAARCGVSHGLLVGHGTDALRLGLAAVLDHDGLEYGGEVIVPNFSFIASATAALDRRLGVVLVDVDPETLLLDPIQVEAAIVPGRTRAIVPVHLFGQPANMTALRELSIRHGVPIVEDAAQAHGAVWESGPVGSFGAGAAFSFQSSKCLSSGEGGAFVTDDGDIFARMYSLQNVGRDRVGGGRWEHRRLGWNCRPTEYQAALLLHRMAQFDARQVRKKENFAYLASLLAGVTSVVPVATDPRVREHGMYMFAMRYRREACGGLEMEDYLAALQAEGIPMTRAFRATLAEQPVLRSIAERHPDYVRVCATPAADRAARDTVYLSHEIFLGRRRDMEDVLAAVLKVEARFR